MNSYGLCLGGGNIWFFYSIMTSMMLCTHFSYLQGGFSTDGAGMLNLGNGKNYTSRVFQS